MKSLSDTLIIASAIGCSLIGLHQWMLGNFAQNYWLFMLTFGLFTWYMLRKKKREQEN